MAGTQTSALGLLGQRTVARSSGDGGSAEVELRVIKDGSLSVIPWESVVGLEGRVFVVNYGTPGALVTGATSITGAQPMTNLDVPSGTVVIPLMMNVVFAAAAGTVSNFVLRSDTALVGAGTSSAATVAPTTLLGLGTAPTSGAVTASLCTARQAYSGSGTTPTGVVDLWGFNVLAASGAGSYATWSPPFLPVIVGPGAINGYTTATTTAPNLFAQLYFLELPSTAV